MLNFGTKRPAAPGFTLDKGELARRRRFKRREWRALITLPLALVAVALVIEFFMGLSDQIGDATAEYIPQEARLERMAAVTFDGAPPLPSAAEIGQVAPRVAQILDDAQAVWIHVNELDAVSVAWATAQLERDRADPPIPQRVIARDLVARPDGGSEVHSGVPVMISGVLVQSRTDTLAGSDQAWQRLVIEMDEGQLVQALAPVEAATIPVGVEVQAVGRFIGQSTLPIDTANQPAATSSTTPDQTPDPAPARSQATVQALPLIAARVVNRLIAGTPSASTDLAEFRGLVPGTLPSDLFSDVDDERTLIETRPYYYLLGQVKNDLTSPDAYAQAGNGNLRANDLHMDPAAFRGQPFTVTGYVYSAWEDQQVAQDQPFGIGRVVRLLIWSRDISMYSEQIDGVDKPALKSVLRLFELAVSGNQSLPCRGTHVVATGRFLKQHAIPVKIDQQRDRRNRVQRQSDKIYPWFYVANGYRVVPMDPGYRFSIWGIAIMIVVLVAGFWFWRIGRREAVSAAKVATQVRRLRERRQELRHRLRAGGGAVPSPTGDGAPSTGDPPQAAKDTPPPAPGGRP